MQIGRRLLNVNTAWRHGDGVEHSSEIWHQILKIPTDQVFAIATVNCVPQPVVATNALKHLPEKGLYNWHPGAYFGIYKPDSFWFTKERR